MELCYDFYSYPWYLISESRKRTQQKSKINKVRHWFQNQQSSDMLNRMNRLLCHHLVTGEYLSIFSVILGAPKEMRYHRISLSVFLLAFFNKLGHYFHKQIKLSGKKWLHVFFKFFKNWSPT